MREIKDFSLERHTGEHETRPLRSRLRRNGEPLSLTLPGYILLRQYATVDGYLFVTDHDCLYEEGTNFILVDEACKRIIGKHVLSAAYVDTFLGDIFWQDERHFTAIMRGSETLLEFTISRFSIPYLYPKLWCKYR